MASNLGGVRSSADIDPALAVERATVLVGPALILTTVVLACGLVVTVFSDLPSLRLFERSWIQKNGKPKRSMKAKAAAALASAAGMPLPARCQG